MDIKLWDHQKKAIERAARERDLALFFEQGTGKTITAACILAMKLKFHRGIGIVVCPKIVMNQWKRELIRVGFAEKNVVIMDHPSKDAVKVINKTVEAISPVVFVINYEKVRAPDIIKRIKTLQLTAVVFDESHLIKSHNSLRAKACVQIADHALHRYILTGTPIVNSLEDIFKQFRCLDRGETFGKSFWGFRNCYFYNRNANSPKHVSWPDWKPKPESEEVIKKWMSVKSMRVTKEQCLDLPPLVRQTIDVELSSDQKRLYKEMKRDLIAYIADAKDSPAVIAQTAAVKALRMQQIVTGHVKDTDGTVHTIAKNPRIEALREIIEPILHQKAKVVIWACYKHDIKIIEKMLDELEVVHFKIDGSVDQSLRENYVKEFSRHPAPCVMVCNQSAAGTGLDGLQCATYMIYYSKNFNLTHDLQSESRAHRGGSEVHSKVTRIDLVAPNTIDEHINNALHNKQNLADRVVDVFKKMKGQI